MSDLQLREGGVEDVVVVADLATAMRPDEPVDPVVQRYLWDGRNQEQIENFYVAERDGEPVGFTVTSRRAWPEDDDVRMAHIDIGITPEWMTAARVRQLIQHSVDAVRAEGARIVEGRAREDETWLREALVAAGLEQDHLSKVWELDLIANRDRLLAIAAESRARSRAIGVRCITLAACELADKLTRLHRLNELCRLDMPRSIPALPNPKGLFMRWMGMPGITPERYWVAELDEELVAMSFMRYPPVRGHVWTGFTGSHPEHRGKGIARAVKMETLAQAIGLGVPSVRTDNDERNAPMLHINQGLGYHSIPAWVSHLKRLGPAADRSVISTHATS